MDAGNGIDAPSSSNKPQGAMSRDPEVISLLSSEGTPVPEIIPQGSRPFPTKRRPEDVAGQHEAKRYKESTRRDGATVIDLDSDEDIDSQTIIDLDSDEDVEDKAMIDLDSNADVEGSPAAQTGEQMAKNTRGISKAYSGTPAQAAGASRPNSDQGAQRRRRQDSETASPRCTAAQEVDRIVHRGPDRRVRCETVEDEETEESTVIHQYQLHPRLLDS
ncbi:hypothetical protein BJ166DRAFT_217972 [Pestalotiopsis sp. NC0098]|nr:hypothetical protein BJ166DRAFT_217972 [Pestalotiopsis sp. NC0098]